MVTEPHVSRNNNYRTIKNRIAEKTLLFYAMRAFLLIIKIYFQTSFRYAITSAYTFFPMPVFVDTGNSILDISYAKACIANRSTNCSSLHSSCQYRHDMNASFFSENKEASQRKAIESKTG